MKKMKNYDVTQAPEMWDDNADNVSWLWVRVPARAFYDWERGRTARWPEGTNKGEPPNHYEAATARSGSKLRRDESNY